MGFNHIGKYKLKKSSLISRSNNDAAISNSDPAKQDQMPSGLCKCELNRNQACKCNLSFRKETISD